MLEIIDRAFEIVFARFRRSRGEGQIEFAWHLAAGTVCGYLVLPLAAATLVVIVLIYALAGYGTPGQRTQMSQAIGLGILLTALVVFHHRFRRLLLSPPELRGTESRSERNHVLLFRAFCFGVFAAVCLGGFILHKAGVAFMRGI